MKDNYGFAMTVIAVFCIGYWIYDAVKSSAVGRYIQDRQTQKRIAERAKEIAELNKLVKEIEDAKIDYDAAKRKLNQPSDPS